MDPAEMIDEQRHVGPLLATVIVALPVNFVWLLLRKGYAPSTRWAGFVYMTAITAIGVLGRELGN